MIVTCAKHKFTPKLGFITTKNVLRYHVNLYGCKETAKTRVQVNKIFGFGELSLRSIWWAITNARPIHHYNSIRWGWIWDEKREQWNLYAYKRDKGSLGYTCIAISYEPGDLYSIELIGNEAKMSHNDVIVHVDQYKNTRLKLHLSPYYGGKEPTSKELYMSIIPYA